MAASIDELLKALSSPTKASNKTLENNASTWSRIGKKDSFDELGLEKSELESFLKEWCENNPYSF